MPKIHLAISERLSALLVLSLISGFFLPASATTTSCSIQVLGGINFTYDPAGTTSNGTIGSITCNYINSAEPVYIYLVNVGSMIPRRMQSDSTNGNTFLDYNLYANASYSLVWGNGLNGTTPTGPFSCIASSSSQCQVDLPPPNNSIFGKIPAAAIPPGRYTQKIMAIVSNSANGGPTLGSTLFTVSTEVPTLCSIHATNVSLNYPTRSPTAVRGNSSLGVQCNAAGNYAVMLQSENNPQPNGQGILKSGSNILYYQLYQPNSNTPNAACAYTIPWGNAPGLLLSLPNPNPNNYNICLSMPASQDAVAGSYSDNVKVTLNF